MVGYQRGEERSDRERMATAIEKCKAAEEVVQDLEFAMKFDSSPRKPNKKRGQLPDEERETFTENP